MRLLFDHQVFTWQKSGGISRVMSELLSRINKGNLHSSRVPLRFSDNEYIFNNNLASSDVEPCFDPLVDYQKLR